MNEMVVRHEMLHDLLGRRRPSGPAVRQSVPAHLGHLAGRSRAAAPRRLHAGPAGVLTASSAGVRVRQPSGSAPQAAPHLFDQSLAGERLRPGSRTARRCPCPRAARLAYPDIRMTGRCGWVTASACSSSTPLSRGMTMSDTTASTPAPPSCTSAQRVGAVGGLVDEIAFGLEQDAGREAADGGLVVHDENTAGSGAAVRSRRVVLVKRSGAERNLAGIRARSPDAPARFRGRRIRCLASLPRRLTPRAAPPPDPPASRAAPGSRLAASAVTPSSAATPTKVRGIGGPDAVELALDQPGQPERRARPR